MTNAGLLLFVFPRSSGWFVSDSSRVLAFFGVEHAYVLLLVPPPPRPEHV